MFVDIIKIRIEQEIKVIILVSNHLIYCGNRMRKKIISSRNIDRQKSNNRSIILPADYYLIEKKLITQSGRYIISYLILLFALFCFVFYLVHFLLHEQNPRNKLPLNSYLLDFYFILLNSLWNEFVCVLPHREFHIINRILKMHNYFSVVEQIHCCFLF